ncbi:indolepyruvate ferredoxin oxidoreductase subunit alpha [Rhodoplanes roseus]|uniref:Indolepyruvate oxidoreductase subunit IorA n=1 Tax=Rhodoplanes roseus TaxID=29409 RepID=A0A327L0C7_9BRAD|nr:indolepyruvate ferredoxin oxidoreductase subunit alpha [Rhodoplanes roseus]RAI43385.1 indolepyruvate ferredoxin oxidoreductase subunit alpha [Rhodoplanes roseus]
MSTEALAQERDADARSRAEAFPFTGNEAIARGAWEAGVRVAAAYPGTPSTEILETLAEYDPTDVTAQWSTNEKVALDTAIGASFAGVRALAAMKHVGLNVAADSLMSMSYIGAHGGLVVVVCDDPGIHSSQNEQDTRLFCRLAGVPVLEPADAQEALEFTRIAFDLSEQFETPVILRGTTRLSHTRSVVRAGPRRVPPSRGFIGDHTRTVTIPANARRLHPKVIAREAALSRWMSETPLTQHDAGSDRRCGIVTSGLAYLYVKEAAPAFPVLKLAGSYPLAVDAIRDFAASVERVIVVEELEPALEQAIRAIDIPAEGKSLFPRLGELSVELLREGLAKAGLMEAPAPVAPLDITPMARPPVLCSGCPHTASFLALRSIGAHVAGDIGCYTLAAIDPLRSMDTCVCMGASIGNAIGMAKAGCDKPVVATIGDSTFLHSGIPPLIDAVYNKADITVLILDNHITAMTGGQDHPGTGRDLRGDAAPRVDTAALCRAIGIEWVRVIDPYEVGRLLQTLREATAHHGVSVVIASRPCVLDPVKIKGAPVAVRAAGCIACQSCMNLGCPSITWSGELFEGRHKVTIDAATCIGCTLCAQVCPTDCIQPVATGAVQ